MSFIAFLEIECKAIYNLSAKSYSEHGSTLWIFYSELNYSMKPVHLDRIICIVKISLFHSFYPYIIKSSIVYKLNIAFCVLLQTIVLEGTHLRVLKYSDCNSVRL